MDAATHAYFHPLLTQLQDTGFFRHFKVNLDSGCPFWDDSQELCAMKACAVETCGPGDVPQPWLEGAEGAEGGEGANDTGEGEACGPLSTAELMMRYVTRTGDDAMEVERWSEGESSDVWIDQNEEKGMVFVDLKLNPERYTGYSGPSANRVWRAIHEENCFSFDNDGQCLEKRVFFRLISGLQASISTHIAREYYYGSDFGDDDGTWGPNLKLFVERVGSHEDRLHNMYFAYLFLLRAVAKAAPELELFDYNTGNTTDDARVVSLVKALVRPDHPLVDASTAAQTCQHGFDESKLFQVQSGNYALDELNDLEQHLMQQRALDLKREFQGRFRNISRIMDCVGCEKCRLWGKLQILGIGTALKVLMTNDDNLHLQRNEVIALLNTLGQVSRSVKLVQDWRHQEFENAILTLGCKCLPSARSAAVWSKLLALHVLCVCVCVCALSVGRRCHRICG